MWIGTETSPKEIVAVPVDRTGMAWMADGGWRTGGFSRLVEYSSYESLTMTRHVRKGARVVKQALSRLTLRRVVALRNALTVQDPRILSVTARMVSGRFLLSSVIRLTCVVPVCTTPFDVTTRERS